MSESGNGNKYYVAIDGKPEGPMTRADAIALIAEGKMGADTKVWTPGMKDWAAASDFVEFAGHFASRDAAEAAARAAKAAPPPKPLDMSRALEDGLAALQRTPWRAGFGAFVYVFVATAVNSWILGRFAALADDVEAPVALSPALAWWLLVLLIFAVVLRAGFCLFTLFILRGKEPPLWVLFAGAARMAPLIPYALLYGLSVFVGLTMLILPGIFLAVAFSFGFYYIMESRLGPEEGKRMSWEDFWELVWWYPITAMRVSYRAVRGLGWLQVFLVYLVSFLGFVAIAMVAGAVGATLGAPTVGVALELLLAAGWAAATALVIAAVYEQARRNRERAARG